MATNVRFGYIFPSDDATLTASSEKTNMPGTNLQLARPGKVWQSVDTELSNITIDFDMGAAKEISGFFLGEHNLTADATVNIQADDASNFSSLDVDESIPVSTLTKQDGTTEVVPRLAFFWAAVQNYRYWRLKITDAANPDTYLEAGILKLFEYTEPAINIIDNVRRTPTDPSVNRKTAGRFPRRKIRPWFWTYSVQFGGELPVSRAQQDEWLAMISEVGNGAGVVFGLDPENHPTDDTIYGTMDAMGEFQHDFLDQSQITGIRIVEARRGTYGA